jgi:hypothetical protein
VGRVSHGFANCCGILHNRRRSKNETLITGRQI